MAVQIGKRARTERTDGPPPEPVVRSTSSRWPSCPVALMCEILSFSPVKDFFYVAVTCRSYRVLIQRPEIQIFLCRRLGIIPKTPTHPFERIFQALMLMRELIVQYRSLEQNSELETDPYYSAPQNQFVIQTWEQVEQTVPFSESLNHIHFLLEVARIMQRTLCISFELNRGMQQLVMASPPEEVILPFLIFTGLAQGQLEKYMEHFKVSPLAFQIALFQADEGTCRTLAEYYRNNPNPGKRELLKGLFTYPLCGHKVNVKIFDIFHRLGARPEPLSLKCVLLGNMPRTLPPSKFVLIQKLLTLNAPIDTFFCEKILGQLHPQLGGPSTSTQCFHLPYLREILFRFKKENNGEIPSSFMDQALSNCEYYRSLCIRDHALRASLNARILLLFELGCIPSVNALKEKASLAGLGFAFDPEVLEHFSHSAAGEEFLFACLEDPKIRVVPFGTLMFRLLSDSDKVTIEQTKQKDRIARAFYEDLVFSPYDDKGPMFNFIIKTLEKNGHLVGNIESIITGLKKNLTEAFTADARCRLGDLSKLFRIHPIGQSLEFSSSKELRLLLTFNQMLYALKIDSVEDVKNGEWLKKYLIEISTQEDLEIHLKELIELYKDCEKDRALTFVVSVLQHFFEASRKRTRELFGRLGMTGLGRLWGNYRPTQATVDLFAQFPMSIKTRSEVRDWLLSHHLSLPEPAPSPAAPAPASAALVSLRSLPAPLPPPRLS